LLDDHSELEPPDPIPNSEVKRLSADGSVGFPHVRVGHRQALNLKRPDANASGRFSLCGIYRYRFNENCPYATGFFLLAFLVNVSQQIQRLATTPNFKSL
jgi:hypothetical protein